MSEDVTLTRGEVAAMFGVTPRTVILWARAGKLPSFRTPGGTFRFRKAEVIAFVNNSTESSIAEGNRNGVG
jgi:excisionase family DNA binding protein